MATNVSLNSPYGDTEIELGLGIEDLNLDELQKLEQSFTEKFDPVFENPSPSVARGRSRKVKKLAIKMIPVMQTISEENMESLKEKNIERHF